MPNTIDTLSFEDALKELESIVKTLESGNIELSKAISVYERGSLLKNHCQKKLREAKKHVEKINIDANGTPTTQPLSTDTNT